MADIRIPRDINVAMARFALPTVTQWNRVEGRPRTVKFDRSMRAEVRDALWMLTRQWQLGEFKGDDAGSPVLCRMRVDHTRLTKAKFGEDPVEKFEGELPLETRVERMRVPLMRSDRKIGLDLRLLLGRQWLASIAGIGAYADKYRAKYKFETPDVDSPDDADTCAHPGALAMVSAFVGRAMDGGELYLHLLEPGATASDGVALDDPGDKADLDTAGDALVAWFQRLIAQPELGHDGAWTPDRLEYQFDCSAPSGEKAKVYTATEYASGRLDWWATDVDPDRTSLDDQPEDATVIGSVMSTTIPAPLTFDGMPNSRWWSFEDGKVNLGQVTAATTDLAKLLFLEFGLVYSNDWFLTPFTVPAGTVVDVVGCAVTNTFGERFWIAPAAAGDDEDELRRFTLFTSSVLGDAHLPADTSLVLMPTAPTVLDGPTHEEVLLLRDEMANMVWGVERSVALPDGTTRPGTEVGYETRAFLERLVTPAAAVPDTADADIKYRVMNSVPEHWIPFIPARPPAEDRSIRLQRAAMLRLIDGDSNPKPPRVRPQTSLLRDGLDATPERPYLLCEEEVPREGARVITHFQRTRWRDGRVVVWLGARKVVGRGEGSSGLGFDRIVPTKRDQE